MDIEDRVRNLETTISFLKGALLVGTAAVVIFFGVTSFMQIPNQITEQIDKKIGKDTRAKIDDALSKADNFLHHEAHDIWPEGQYCIISNGACPKGFTRTEGYLKAISIFPNGNRTDYIHPSSPNAGGLLVRCHGSCDKTDSSWIGEIHISTCCK